MHSIYQSVTAEAAAHLQIRRGIVTALFLSLAANVFLAGHIAFQKDASKTVVLAPDAASTYIAQADTVSPNLLEKFAFESAHLILDLTPATAANRSSAFLKNVASGAYAEIASQVRRGVAELVRNQASSVFYARETAVDAKLLAVCVAGERRMMIARSVTETAETVLCLRHRVSAGRLQITDVVLKKTAENPEKVLSDFTKGNLH